MTDIPKSIHLIAEQLEHPSYRVGGCALNMLARFAEEGTDVTAAFPALLKKMVHLSPIGQAIVVRIFRYAAQADFDISAVLPRLPQYTEGHVEGGEVRSELLLAQLYHARNTGNWKDINGLLESGGRYFSQQTAKFFRFLDLLDPRVQPAIPLLVKALGNDYYGARLHARRTILRYTGVCSFERLDAFEHALQKAYSEYRRKQSQTAGENYPDIPSMAGIMKNIADRKAKQVRERDGELLVGETIKRSAKGGRSGGIYRIATRRSNG